MRLKEEEIKKLAESIQIELKEEEIIDVINSIEEITYKLDELLEFNETCSKKIKGDELSNVFNENFDEDDKELVLETLNNFNGEYFVTKKVVEDENN